MGLAETVTAAVGVLAIAFEFANPAAVDDAYQRIVDAGYIGHIKPWDAVWGQRYAVIKDPDGNAVDLFANLATD